MADEEENRNGNAGTAQRGRSRAYPVVDLATTIGMFQKVVESLGRGRHERQAVGEILGYSNVTGGRAARLVAALVHYGLMDVNGGSYTNTALGDKLTHPIDDDERNEALREAFNLPTLFRELNDKFRPQGRVPKQLATILYRDHGITRQACQEAAEVFLRSGVSAGVLDNQGAYVGATRTTASYSDPPVEKRTEHAVTSHVQHPAERTAAAPAQGEQSFVFALTKGRTARLVVPRELSPGDVKIITKQVELLALQAEMERETEHERS